MGGGFSEQVGADLFQLFKLDDDMSYEQAVCCPIVLRTMFEALIMFAL